MNLGISFFNIHLLILFCKNVFYFLLYLIFSGSAKSSRANNGITFSYTFTPAGLFRPPGLFLCPLPWLGRLRLSQGIKTFCPPTADSGAKAGFKMQRLSQGSGTFCKQSLHLGIVLGSKRVKVRKGTTALLAKPQFSLSYNLSLSWQALTFIAHSHFFS